MEINYNLISLIDILGFIQGIILGVLLLAINRRKDKSTLFLGLFILTYALELLPEILNDLGILNYYPEYILLPFNFTWLTFPLFYIYVQQVSIFSESKKSYKTLIPGIIAFCIGIFIFFQSVEVKKEIEESLWYALSELLGILYSISIGFLTLKWIKKHIAEIKNQYASVEYKVLNWARLFVFIGLIHTSIIIVFAFLDDSYQVELFIAITNVILLYWVSMRGVLQRNVTMLISSSEKNSVIEKKKTSSENSQKILRKFLK